MQLHDSSAAPPLPASGDRVLPRHLRAPPPPITPRGAHAKQYVVLAAGGHGSLGTTPGDSVLAYTLE